MTAFVLGLLLVAGQPAVDPTEVWPQWRGPAGNSVAPGKDLPTHWSTKENVDWKTALPGWGTSTPILWKDAVFVTTQVDDSKLLLLRLDVASGKVVWERQVGEGKPRRSGPVGVGRFHDEHNMASPSPVTDGEHVWVHFGNGDLACFDFDGKKIWAKNLTETYGVYSIWWGHANSPVLVGDLLISVCMQDPKGGGKSYVLAQDKRTGKEKWLTPRDYQATAEPADSYTTPLILDNQGKKELLVFGANVLDSYDPETGKRLWWSRPFKGNRVISGPTLAGKTVFAIQGMKGPVFAIEAGGTGDTTATSVKWQVTGANPDAACPVVANGLVFLANNAGVVTCLDAETGKEVWKERLGDGFRATPLVVGDKVYFFAKEGKATIVEAARQYKVVSTADLEDQLVASPAAAQGSLFLRTRGHLYRIGKAK